MKTVLPWIIAVGSVAFALGTLHRGSAPSPVPVASMPTAQLAPAPAGLGTGKVVHSFEDDDQIQAFTALWQQRQTVRMRITLLEDYWNNEQTTLATLSEQITGQYDLDLTNSFFLDGEAFVLRIRPDAGLEEESTPEDWEIAYTFPDEESLTVFTVVWQQQQANRMRLTLLQSYWNQEQAGLARLNNQLAREYSMRTDMNYFLNGERRELIERPQPAAAQPPAEQPAQ